MKAAETYCYSAVGFLSYSPSILKAITGLFSGADLLILLQQVVVAGTVYII